MKKRPARNYTIRIKDVRYESGSLRRFLNHVRTIKWEKPMSVYVRVSYGMDYDNYGQHRTFFNDGYYTDKQEFEKAVKAFLE